MQLEAQALERAARNRHLTPSMQFTLYRWVELMEPSNHFFVAASALIDPLSSVRELREAVKNLSGTGVRPGEVLDRSQSLRRVLKMHGRLGRWFAPEEAALKHALVSAEQTTPSQKRRGERHYDFLGRRLRMAKVRFGPVVTNELQKFEAALLDPGTGYLNQLLSEISTRFGQEPTTLADWRHLDHVLEWLGAHVLERGRDSHAASMAVVRALGNADSSQDAIDRFISAFLEAQRSFVVATTVEGARSIRGAPGFGCLPVETQPVWPGTVSAENQRRLDDLLDEVRGKRKGSGCVVMVRVNAWDPGNATREALGTVGQLVDHACAQHPGADINLGTATLVLDEANRNIRDTSRRLSSVSWARTHRKRSELVASLRFYGMARQERVPVVAVLHTWIALENLAPDRTKYIPRNGAAAVALAALRAQLTTVFKELKFLAKKQGQKTRWKSVEKWLEVRPFGPAVPLPKWLELLREIPSAGPAPRTLTTTDSANQAAFFLRDLAQRLGPFAVYRLQDVADRVTNSGELANWAADIRSLASLQITRMRYLRHAAVHRARHHDDAAQQLAIAAHDIADAIYEVLPGWLDAGQNLPQALRSVSRHCDQLIDGWTNGPRLPSIDPERLTQP